jgi:hypothetical protein
MIPLVFENQIVPIRYPLEDANASIKSKHWKRYENNLHGKEGICGVTKFLMA